MGILDKIKTYKKEKVIEYKQRAAASKAIRKKSTAAYYREKENQELRYSKAKARVETDRKIKALNTKPSGGFFSSSNDKGNFNSANLTNYLVGGSSASTVSKSPRARTTYVKTTKYVKGKGGVLRKVSGYKKRQVRQKKTSKSNQEYNPLNNLI